MNDSEETNMRRGPSARVSAILTAAGESTRMGSPKPLLRWHGVTLVEYQTRCLLEGGVSEVVVVLGHRAEDVIPFVKGPNVRYVVNSRYREGKTTSIKTGLAAVSLDADAIALLAVDQPRTADVVSRVVTSYIENDTAITSPDTKDTAGIRSYSQRVSGRNSKASPKRTRAFAKCFKTTWMRSQKSLSTTQ